jgi:hypothetical protein
MTDRFRPDASLFPLMSPDERRRWDQGRQGWQADAWQDHCGDPDCDHPGNCCSGEIPTDDRVAAARANLAKRLRL